MSLFMSELGREDLREAITRVALDLGREQGEVGLTMRAIAGRMGISATALYQHFESKAAILDQIWVAGLEDLSRALEPATLITPCQDGLIELGLRYLQFARENPWVYEILMSKPPADQTRFAPEQAARSQRGFRMIIEMIQRGITREEVPPSVSPVRAALHNWASLHGMASHLLTGRFSSSYPTVSSSVGDEFVLRFVQNLAYTTTETCPPWFKSSRTEGPANRSSSPVVSSSAEA